MSLLFNMIYHFSSIRYLAWRPYACYIKTNSVMRVISGSFGRYITNEIQSPMGCRNYEIGNFGYYFNDWICISVGTVCRSCPFSISTITWICIEVKICAFLFFFLFFYKNIVLVIFTFFFYVSRDFPTWMILHACCIT